MRTADDIADTPPRLMAHAQPSRFSGPHFDAPVLVTGLPRSGTSMVAGLLREFGLWLGETVPGGPENPRGFFENIILREKLQKELLRRGKVDPLGVNPLPAPGWHPDVRNFRDVVGRVLAAEGYTGAQPWGFKDAKMALTWRIWHQHFPAARWIVVRRPTEQIVGSCLRTSFMRHHSGDPEFWRRFVDAYLARLAQLRGTTSWCRVVESGEIVEGRFEQLERLVGELGLEWRRGAVESFIEPEAWHLPELSNA